MANEVVYVVQDTYYDQSVSAWRLDEIYDLGGNVNIESHVCGVFSTLEKAQKYLDNRNMDANPFYYPFEFEPVSLVDITTKEDRRRGIYKKCSYKGSESKDSFMVEYRIIECDLDDLV